MPFVNILSFVVYTLKYIKKDIKYCIFGTINAFLPSVVLPMACCNQIRRHELCSLL